MVKNIYLYHFGDAHIFNGDSDNDSDGKEKELLNI